MIPDGIAHDAKTGRSPYGERGLKCLDGHGGDSLLLSLSLRRAWIEMSCPKSTSTPSTSRSPYGERGLKCEYYFGMKYRRGRSPYGERGLKSARALPMTRRAAVALLTESVD